MSETADLDRARPRGSGSLRPAGSRTVIVTSVASDSHTWNLVFLQLLIEELGFGVINLGACVPDELLVSESLMHRPEMVVVSSVNGHGYQDGMRLIATLRDQAELWSTPVVIGGKLGIAGGESTEHIDALLRAGFDGVFDDRADGPASFRRFVTSMIGGSEEHSLAAADPGANE